MSEREIGLPVGKGVMSEKGRAPAARDASVGIPAAAGAGRSIPARIGIRTGHPAASQAAISAKRTGQHTGAAPVARRRGATTTAPGGVGTVLGRVVIRHAGLRPHDPAVNSTN